MKEENREYQKVVSELRENNRQLTTKNTSLVSEMNTLKNNLVTLTN